ncbi:universal stress protein [Streptomyces sp. NPDC001410]|uniref:universal stress protein n=1 Tax=Streptomyces sp. NPDC001410 TaxID=3364574 RepID=UPI0036AAB37C
MSDDASSGRRVVVGVDGSEPSKAALRWAVGQARLTGGVVEAVLARATLEAVDVDRPVRVTPCVMEGNPARVLLDAAQGADLLVPGAGGTAGSSAR